MSGGELDEVADELYRLPLSAFTSTRDARAAQAARSGDRERSAAIKKLRKPTTGAWLANLLAHERPDDVERLIELGADLRTAQGRLAGDDLRRLSQQRHELVAALSAEAGRLAGAGGQAAGEAALGELVETLEAALSDEGAAMTLRTGRLTTRLQHTGLGFGDVTAGVPAKAASAPTSTGHRGNTPDANRRRQARAGAVEARRRLAQQRAVRERAEREVDRVTARIGELEEEARSVRAEAERARKALRAARAKERQAEKADERAQADLRRIEP